MAQWPGHDDSQQLIRRDRSMVSISDDNMMMRQIQATHAPDGREVDVKPLFNLVEDILNRATFQTDIDETVYLYSYVMFDDIKFLKQHICTPS